VTKIDRHTRHTRPSQGRQSRLTRFARWALLLFALAVLIDAIVGERGWLATVRARKAFEANASAIEHQREKNARLREQVLRLTDDPAVIEELARGELGLMRPGEKVFIIKDLKPPAAR
jgi:cell division protein FtsB